MIHYEESKEREKMEKASLEISNKKKFSKALNGFSVLYNKSHEELKEKDTVKTAWDDVKFVPNGN